MIADCGNIFIPTILLEKLKNAELVATNDVAGQAEPIDSTSDDAPRPEATQISAEH